MKKLSKKTQNLKKKITIEEWLEITKKFPYKVGNKVNVVDLLKKYSR